MEQYLLKKNKRFLNIVFLSFKFPHFCELFFKLPEISEDTEIYDQTLFKRTALSACLTNATKIIDDIKLHSEEPQMLINHCNNRAELIFRVNVNLRKVKIFVRK